LGSGTTAKVAMQNERSSIGYEIDSNLLSVIAQKTRNKGNKDTEAKMVEDRKNDAFQPNK